MIKLSILDQGFMTSQQKLLVDKVNKSKNDQCSKFYFKTCGEKHLFLYFIISVRNIKEVAIRKK
jgi:hypothetical protein